MSLDAYPRIADWIGTLDGKVLIHTGKVDIGQRISTALVQIVHEELAIPPDQIEIAPVSTDEAPDEGITSGSNSIEQSGYALRCAAASLRVALIRTAMERFGAEEADWQLADGQLSAPGINRPMPLVDLMTDAVLDEKVDPGKMVLSARDAPPVTAMRGLTEIVTGSYQYVHDLDVPGMLHARVIRPPHMRARLQDVPALARNILEKWSLQLVRDGSFLAIAGANEWTVTEAATKFSAACSWSSEEGISEEDIFAQLSQAKAKRFLIEDSTPSDADIPPEPENPSLKARFERPFTMHGALAPSAAMATFSDGKLSIFSHSQGIYPLRDSIADSLGLSPDQVRITHMPGSGCYGHNGADDAAFEAALVAMALPDTPILLKWTRTEEHAWEPYGTAMAVELAATMDEEGIIRFYSAEAISGTHRGRPRAGPNRAGPSKFLANQLRADPIALLPAMPNMNRHGGMHRNLDPIYAFDDKRLVKNLIDGLPHRTSALRCLGNAANIFALESFVDEAARQVGRDPWDFRKAHLQDPRAVAVLERLQACLPARTETEEAFGRGIAYAQYKNAMARVGVCVDLEVTEMAEVRLLKATLVADAGRVIDADGLRAQLEGGFIQGASWALCEQVTWDRDGITSLDWETYPVIRFDQIPAFEIDILDQPLEAAVGAGEAAPGPAIAAIANAIFDAIGIRMRRMPFTPGAIMGAAAKE